MVWSGCATGLGGDTVNSSGTRTVISGEVIGNTGGDVEYWVEYGTTPSYGSASAHNTTFDTQPNEARQVFVKLTGLQRSTSYHFRVCAQDSQQSGGPGCGSDREFTTPNLECGDTITQDFTLSADVTCESFSTDGLIVGADGIDINLDGHTLRGPLMGFLDSGSPLAISNAGGHDDVTIRNGTVTSWGSAIVATGASFMVIRNVSAVGNTSGITLRGGESNTIRTSGMTGSRFRSGLFVDGSDALVVADSSGTKWDVEGNDNRLVRNQIGDAGQFAICLYVFGHGNRIADNTVGGCPAGNLVLAAGANNVILRNETSGAPSDPSTSGEPDGIFVGPFTANTLLQGNYSHDNDDDGFDVRGTGTRLQDNRAENNGDWGIDAVAGVTDLGGNTASGNGNAPQCHNVFCQ
jgi:hypothetical protein